MSKLQDFYNKLETFRKPESDDPYDRRITHCYLAYTHDNKEHTFEVRGWRDIKNGVLCISVVNWTLCAGSAIIEMDEEIVDEYRIRECYEQERADPNYVCKCFEKK
jgi:hypothetical protein